MKMIIGNVNINNADYIHDIAGLCGFAGSVEHVDEITREIDLLDDEKRAELKISVYDVEKMVKKFIKYGFDISFRFD